MHELLTELSSHTQRQFKQYHLPSCMSTVSTVHMQQHELWTYYFVDHTPWYRSTVSLVPRSEVESGDEQLLKLTTAMVTFSLCSNIESTTTVWQRTDLEARWPCGLHASRPINMRSVYGHPCLCTRYGTAILTNRGPSELVASRVHLLCPPG